jgi:hypothetical protein
VRRPLSKRHLLDLPADLDQVRTLCGDPIEGARRGDTITNLVALVTCVGCLRAHAASSDARIAELERRLAEATGKGET